MSQVSEYRSIYANYFLFAVITAYVISQLGLLGNSHHHFTHVACDPALEKNAASGFQYGRLCSKTLLSG